MNKGKRGKPFEYPKGFVRFLAPIRVFFHLPYRQEEGFVEALAKLLPKLKVPDYSTIYWRISTFVPEFEQSLADLDDEVVIAVDSSGIKVTNKGEWVRRQGERKRKGYLKIPPRGGRKDKANPCPRRDRRTRRGFGKILTSCRGGTEVANVVKALGMAYDSKEAYETWGQRGSRQASGLGGVHRERLGDVGRACARSENSQRVKRCGAERWATETQDGREHHLMLQADFRRIC